MIFVGNGALLKEALAWSVVQQHNIDFVFVIDDDLEDFLASHHICYKITDNINKEVDLLLQHTTDNIIMSINNGQLFKTPVLSLNRFRIYNIHNGLIPAYRGIPEICILFALLNGEQEYGVTLHSVDEGIDTGQAHAVLKFNIAEDATFQQVMYTSLQYCSQIYRDNINHIITGDLPLLDTNNGCSVRYTYGYLNKLPAFIHHANFGRATKMGIFRFWFERMYISIEQCRRYDC